MAKGKKSSLPQTPVKNVSGNASVKGGKGGKPSKEK